MTTTSEGVLVEADGPVLRITLNRPRTLNALTLADVAALHRAVDLPAGIRAVVFAGAGDRAFCAGMDVDTFLGFDPPGARAFIADLRDLMQAVRTLAVPTLCAVDGHCLGAAFELALACDLRIATDRAVFGLPEIKVGIPSVIDAALLSQYVGLSLAKEMILTGDGYPVARLAASGLCNAVVATDQLDATVAGFVARVAGHTATATASQKRLFELWQNSTLIDGAAASVEEFGTVFAAAETAAHLAGYRAALGSRD